MRSVYLFSAADLKEAGAASRMKSAVWGTLSLRWMTDSLLHTVTADRDSSLPNKSFQELHCLLHHFFFRPHRRTVTNNSWFVLFYYVMLWTTWIRALLQMGNIYIKTIIFVQLASVAQPFQIWATMYLTLFGFLILVFFPLSISLFHFLTRKLMYNMSKEVVAYFLSELKL